MNRVRINGQSYALPFATLLRDLTAAEYADLEADIIANGVQYSVIIGVSQTHGRIVIEGAHRARICEKHGLPCPITDWGEVADEFAKSRCLALNVKRRHLTADELKAARTIRIPQVVEARRAGMSLRAIADHVGISRVQVQRDLEDADVPGGTPDEDAEEPERVTGSDGKSYPARRPEPDDDEILEQFTPPPPSDRVATAEEAAIRKLVRALNDAQDAFADLAELNGPRFKRFVRFAKKHKVSVKGGEWRVLTAMRTAVDSVTLRAAGKPA